jgi:transcription elongation factor GreA
MAEDKKFYLTKKGLESLKREYRDLKNLRSVKVEDGVPKIWQSEDVNPEYLAFQEDLGFLEQRLNELEYILKNAELIKPPSKEKQGIVALGAKVTLQEQNGEINEFIIVGTLEANPNEGKISLDSPLGKALLGKKVGDTVNITSPINITYKIKKIKYHLS